MDTPLDTFGEAAVQCKNLVVGIVLALLLAALPVRAADGRSPAGPDGVTRIVVEAEDMKGVDQNAFGGTAPEWRVGRAGIDHYQSNVFGGHWQSRTRTAMTDADGNKAAITAPITVPKTGKYKLWVKYECPPNFNYAFDVSLARSAAPGKEVFRKTYGLIESPKHFCFTKALTYGSLYWTWGIDHDAAEGYEVELAAGDYILTIIKTANPQPAGMRSIDVVMLTSDLSPISSPRMPRYPLLDELRRANHVFLRYRVPGDASGPVKISWNRWGKRYNDFYRPQYTDLVRAYSADGKFLPAKEAGLSKRGQIETPLKPGDTSVWLDVGPCLNVESAATFDCRAQIVAANGRAMRPQPAFIPFTVDIALAPEEKGIVKSFSVAPGETGGVLTFLLQPDLKTKEGVEWSRRLVDVYRTIAAELDKEPRQAAHLPRKMRFYGGTGWPVYPPRSGDWAWQAGMDFRWALGLNTVQGSALGLKPDDYAKLKAYYQEKGDVLMKSAAHHHSQDPDKIAKQIGALGTAGEFYYLSYGDEIGLPPVNVQNAGLVAEFRQYLKERGVTPQQLGLADWAQVKPLNSLSADVAVKIGVVPADRKGAALDRTLKRLYWYSCGFRTKKGVESFAAKTRRLRELLGPRVQTSANLGGMHPFYWVHQSSFIDAFKHNAMTMAWTEDYDYCQPETSRLVVEYLAGYLKCGTKYHGQRMMFFCMPHYPGQSPEHLLQDLILEWGQNVKDTDWFSIPPDGFTTENYVNCRGGMPTFTVIRMASDMAAVTEDWLDPAGPVPARVAMLLSEASDTWEVAGLGQWAVKQTGEATNAFQEERKNTYYALRNAGYRVDLITEEDVREGRLKPYRALYVGGENLERATVAPITAWVKAGGTLYASAGAARKDEYDEPLNLLDAVLGRGARKTWHRYGGALRSDIELPFLKPLDRVKVGNGSFPALATKETFTPAAGATVLATYADGTPAFVSMQTGKGRGYYIGTEPAEAWAQKALPVLPCGKGGPEKLPDGSPRYPSFEPVDFDAAAAGVILRPLRDAGIKPDIQASAPHVVCNRLAGPKGTVITVVNLGMQQRGAVKSLTLSVDGIEGAGKVWSYFFPKGLRTERKGGTLTLTLPKVELVDIVVIEK